jgi:hypothetical protein
LLFFIAASSLACSCGRWSQTYCAPLDTLFQIVQTDLRLERTAPDTMWQSEFSRHQNVAPLIRVRPSSAAERAALNDEIGSVTVSWS